MVERICSQCGHGNPLDHHSAGNAAQRWSDCFRRHCRRSLWRAWVHPFPHAGVTSGAQWRSAPSHWRRKPAFPGCRGGSNSGMRP